MRIPKIRLCPGSLLGQMLLALAIGLLVAQSISAVLLYQASENRREQALLNAATFRLLSNPEARLHEGDLVSDRGGRGGNGGAMHNYSTGNEAKQEAANRFAAEVCKHLEKGRNSHSFGKLYVMAAPHFLGLLRKHQSDALRGLVSDEIANDLTTQSPERIRAKLPEYL